MFAAILFLAMHISSAVEIFVSPNGNDRWSGSIAAPNAKHSDGPLATIAAASQRAATLCSGGKVVTVLLQKGTYPPIRLTWRDSGVGGRPIVYAAYKGERPVISGGLEIANWKVDARGWWRAKVASDWNFSELWVNRQRRYRTRLPSNGYYHIAAQLPPTATSTAKGNDRFQFELGSVKADWYRRQDVEVLAFHNWITSRNRIKDVDEANRVVTFRSPTGFPDSWAEFPKGNRYLVENVREAFGAPGHWYLDRGEHELIYVPMPGEKPDRAIVIAPVVEHLIDLAGDAANHRPVHDIVIRGLDFRHTAWNCPENGRLFPQAEADLSGAIRMDGAKNITLEDCCVAMTGEYAVDIGTACKNILIRHCAFSDLGAGGVKIGETQFVHDDDMLTEHVTVQNCVIQNGGRQHAAAVGVWIGQNPYITVRNNDIHDFYYTGVSVGWSWGYQPSATHDNIIENNTIYDIGQGVLSDMGGIYTLGLQPGTVLRGNVIHDIKDFAYGGWGIYTDEGSTGILIENNIVYRTKSAGFHQHYGKENIIRNNIFAFGEEAQLMRTRVEDHLSFTMERNIILFNDKPLLGGNWSGASYHLDNNLYWRTDGKPFDFAGLTWEQWRAKGQDTHSVIADPKFVNPLKGDFRLAKSSPVLALGFQPIDASKSGPRHPFRRALPKAGPAFPDPFAK